MSKKKSTLSKKPGTARASREEGKYHVLKRGQNPQMTKEKKGEAVRAREKGKFPSKRGLKKTICQINYSSVH